MKQVPPYVGHGLGNNIDNSNFFRPYEPITKFYTQNLPHWEQEGTVQFVTLRLADSLPSSKLEEYEAEKLKLENATESSIEDRQILNKINRWLLLGHGSCIFKYQIIQKILIDALRFYDGKNFDLFDYVIMPNHIHFLILPYKSLKSVITDFKRYTSREINKILRQKNGIWQTDYFDRMIRDNLDWRDTIDYIKGNPAGLKRIH